MRNLIGHAALIAAILVPRASAAPPEKAYAPPSIRLIAPEGPVAYGDMVIVQAAIDKTNLPPDLVDVRHQWVVLEDGKKKTVLIWPDGTQIFFAAGMQPRQFTVVLDTDCFYQTKEGDVIKTAGMASPEPLVATITVGSGPSPPPPPPIPPGPDPAPTPIPGPVLPAGRFGLAQFTFDALTGDVSIQPGDKVKLARALAPSFSKIAAQIAALAEFKDVEGKVLPVLKASNAAAIAASGVPVASTLPFKLALNGQLDTLWNTQHQIQTADDFGDAFREIAQGLAAFK